VVDLFSGALHVVATTPPSMAKAPAFGRLTPRRRPSWASPSCRRSSGPSPRWARTSPEQVCPDALLAAWHRAELASLSRLDAPSPALSTANSSATHLHHKVQDPGALSRAALRSVKLPAQDHRDHIWAFRLSVCVPNLDGDLDSNLARAAHQLVSICCYAER